MCFMESRITILSSSFLQKIMLECLPISSTMRYLVHRSPISSLCSISKMTILSSPGWLTLMMRPEPMCFLSSMQKPGAVMGEGLFEVVKYKRGREGSADMSSL